MRIFRFLALCAAALATVPALPSMAAAQSQVENPEGVWIHKPSGTAFPRFLGTAERTRITEFTSDGRDVGLSYQMEADNGLLILTYYVYPPISDWSCLETFRDAKASVEKRDIAPKVIGQGVKPSPSGKTADSALYARYTFPEDSMADGAPPLVSDLYLSCSGGSGYLVKYRASWTGSESTFPDVAPLTRQIGWGPGLD